MRAAVAFVILLTSGFAPALHAEAPRSGISRALAAEISRLSEQRLVERHESGARAEHDDCRPSPEACVESACAKLGTFGCDQNDEVLAVLRACRGNFDGACLEVSCAYLGAFGCNDSAEVLGVAAACRGAEASCVTDICSRLGTWGCDQRPEVEAVARECGGG